MQCDIDHITSLVPILRGIFIGVLTLNRLSDRMSFRMAA